MLVLLRISSFPCSNSFSSYICSKKCKLSKNMSKPELGLARRENWLACFADKNSRRGNTRCRSKYCPSFDVRSNFAIVFASLNSPNFTKYWTWRRRTQYDNVFFASTRSTVAPSSDQLTKHGCASCLFLELKFYIFLISCCEKRAH